MRFNAVTNWDAVLIVAYTKLGIKRVQGVFSVHSLILDGALSQCFLPHPSSPSPSLWELLFLVTSFYTGASRSGYPVGHDNCTQWTRKIDHFSSSVTLVGKLQKCSFTSLIPTECLSCLAYPALLLENSGVVLPSWNRGETKDKSANTMTAKL